MIKFNGAGGYGGGGGSNAPGGFGGGNGGLMFNYTGSGGWGAGGAIFVRQGASVVLNNTTLQNGSVQGGTPGAPAGTTKKLGSTGLAVGSGLFLAGSATINVDTGQTQTMNDSLGGVAQTVETVGVSAGTTTQSFSRRQITTSAPHGLSYNRWITISGNSVSGYNGTYRVSQVIDATTIILDAPTVPGTGLGGTLSTQDGVTGGFTKGGAGTLVLTAANTYTGGTTVNGGTLALARNAGTTGSPVLAPDAGTVTVNAGATLRFDTSDNFGRHLTDSGPDIVVNGGTVTNSGNYINALQNLTLNGGTMNANGQAVNSVVYGAFSVRRTLTSTGTSTVDLGGNVLTLGQDGDTDFNVTGGTLTLASTVANNVDGPGTLVKNGPGTLLLTGANTYTGFTVVNTGTLAMKRAVQFSGSPTLAINAGPVSIGSAATLRFDNSNNFGNHDANSGPSIEVNGGTVTNSGSYHNALQNLTLNNATLTGIGGEGPYGSYSVRNTLTSTGTSQINLDPANGSALNLSHAGTTTFDVTSGTLTVNARIQNNVSPNPGALLKLGSGTMLLAGPNTYTGGTTVSGGTLAVDGDFHTDRLAPNAGVTITNGATFEIRGKNALPTGAGAVDVTVNGGGTLRTLAGTSAAADFSHAHVRNLTLAGGNVSLDYSGSGTAYGNQGLLLNGTLRATATGAIGATAAVGSNIGLNLTRPVQVETGATLTVNVPFVDEATAGPGAIDKTGPGTLVLTSANTYTGGTTVSAGTLALNRNGAAVGPVLAPGGAITVGSGATLRFDTNNNFGNHDSATGPDIIVNGGTVTNSGAFINALQNLTLNGGSLSATGEFPGYGAFSIRRTLTSTGNSTIGLGGSNRLMLGQDGDTTFAVTGGTLTITSPLADNVDGPGTLNKTGAGTLILRGSIGYTGATNVSGGTLVANDLPGTALNIQNGGTLSVRENIGTLTLGKDLTFAGGAALRLELNAQNAPLIAGVDYDTIVSSARLDLTGVSAAAPVQLFLTAAGNLSEIGRLTLGTFAQGIVLPAGIAASSLFHLQGNPAGLTTVVVEGNQLIVAVPEPTTAALFAAGLTLLGMRRRTAERTR